MARSIETLFVILVSQFVWTGVICLAADTDPLSPLWITAMRRRWPAAAVRVVGEQALLQRSDVKMLIGHPQAPP